MTVELVEQFKQDREADSAHDDKYEIEMPNYLPRNAVSPERRIDRLNEI